MTTATAGQLYRYQAAAHDPNGSAITWLMVRGPAGATVDAITGLVSWTPSAGAPASAEIVLQAFNLRGGHATQQFTIGVAGVNQPPVFAFLEEQINGQEGQPLQIPVGATDADGDLLVYWADNLPAGAVFDPVTQVLDWTPAFGSAGTYANVRFTVSDGVHRISETTTLVIAPGIPTPELLRPADRTVREGDPLRFQVVASDPTGLPLTYASDILPFGAFLDPNTGVFTWTPLFDQHGVYDLPITVSNGVGSTTKDTIVTVLNVNAPPDFGDLGPFQVAEGQTLAFDAFAFDPNNPGYIPPFRTADGALNPLQGTTATVHYSVTGLPAGATFDADTTLLSCTPGYTDAGVYTVHFTATNDGDGTGTPAATVRDVAIRVLDVNRAPVVNPLSNRNMDRGTTLDVNVTATDADAEAMTLTASGLPAFATFVDNGNGTGTLHFAPGSDDHGNFAVSVTASDHGDGNGAAAVLSTTQSFVLTVNAPNLLPHLSRIGSKVAVVGQPIAFAVRASDLDQDALTFGLTGQPSASAFAASATYGVANFTWTPTATDVGAYNLVFTVTDSGNGNPALIAADTQTVHLVVRAANQAPALAPVGSRTTAEDGTLTFTLSAIDADGDAISYSAANLPAGASLDPSTGVFRWSPGLFTAGAYSNIVFTASDGNLSSSQSVTITVQHTNHTPVVLPLFAQAGQEGNPLQLGLAASDIDNDALTFQALSTLPRGAVFDSVSGRFAWTPDYDQAGDYTLSVGVRDPGGLSAQTSVAIHIDNNNRPPTIAASSHFVQIAQLLDFHVQGADPDTADQLRYSSTVLPVGASLDATSGHFVWTPGPTQSGDYPVTFAVSDGQGAASTTVILRAGRTPALPTVTVELTPSFPGLPGQKVLIHVAATSLADITGMTLSAGGQILTLDSQGRGSFTPDHPGRTEVTARATDADGLIGQTIVVIKTRDASAAGPPAVAFAPELNGNQFQTGADVVGTVNDNNLDTWTLQIAPLNSSAFVTLASGSNPFTASAMIHLDPTALPNGFYQLRLTATNISGLSKSVQAAIEVNSATKSGQYLNTATDITVDLGGVSLPIVRQYDSLSGSIPGSVGDGWRLVARDFGITTNVQLTGRENLGVFSPFRVGTRLYLTLPDGRRVGFTFNPVEHDLAGVTYYSPAWTADPGVGYQLTSVDDQLTLAGQRLYDLRTGVPYNPDSDLLTGPSYSLTAPDGTVYRLSATGTTQDIVTPGGNHLIFSDSGITNLTTGDAIGFVHGQGGRLASLTAPDGAAVQYDYDASGHLVAARNLATGTATRYGYTKDASHLLETIASPTGSGGLSVVYGAGAVQELPVTAYLGPVRQFKGATTPGALAAGATDRYLLAVQSSEIASTPGRIAYIGIDVQASASSTLLPGLPLLAGMAPVYTRLTAGDAFAIFAVADVGLQRLDISGTGAGGYSLRIKVLGDTTGDGSVDGVDAATLAAAQGTSTGQAGFIAAADLNQDGAINAADSLLLAGNYGFLANRAPVITPTGAMTHQDLGVVVSLAPMAVDPEEDRVYFHVVGASHGAAILTPDGQSVLFTPAPGYTGPASFQISADDGFGNSAAATVNVTVSAAPLVALDFSQRQPRLNPGDTFPIQLVGDFADQKGVLLQPGYATLQTLDSSIATITAKGRLHAVGNGTTVMTASSHGVQAATAVNVGGPSASDIIRQALFSLGLETSVDAASLAPGNTNQLSVTLENALDLTAAATGTRYFSSNSSIVTVSASGLITAIAPGAANVTVINGPAERVIPIAVQAALVGPVAVGVAGGVVQGSDGSQVMIAPGAVAGDTTISITPMAVAALPMATPASLQSLGAFQLDLGSDPLAHPVQLTVAVPAGTAVGTPVYFFRADSIPDANGNATPIWIEAAVGAVEADGFAHDDTNKGGVYLVATGILNRVRGAISTYGLVNPSSTYAVLGGGYGSYFSLNDGYSIDLAAGFNQLQFEEVPRSGLPLLTPITVNVSTGGTTANATINTIAFSQAKPHVDSLKLNIGDPQGPTLTLIGTDLGDIGDHYEVRFRIGGRDSVNASGARDPISGGRDRTVNAHWVVSLNAGVAPRLEVVVPDDVALGTATISLIRTLASNSKDVRESNEVSFPSAGGYAFAVQSSGQLAVFDTRAKVPALNPTTPGQLVDNELFNKLVKEIDISGGAFSRSVAVTPDNTRAYVTTPNGVAVIDTITLRQIVVGNPVQQISLRTKAAPFGIAIDPLGKFAYVSDGVTGTVFVIDIDPYSVDYNTCQKSITNLTGYDGNVVGNGLRGLAVTGDGSRLFVAAPNELNTGLHRTAPYSSILVIDVDPHSQTRWQEIVRLRADQGAADVQSTARPDVMLFTNFLSDATGVGVITNAQTAPSVASQGLTQPSLPSLGTTIQTAPTLVQFPLWFNGKQPTPPAPLVPANPFAVHNAKSVAMSPDGEYLFVAGFNTPDEQIPSKNHFIPGFNPAGSNIGIFKLDKPFVGTPKLVAATRSIPFGFPESVIVTPDGNYLYVTYPTIPTQGGSGAVFVYSIPAIKTALEDKLNTDKARSQFGIDDLMSGAPAHNPNIDIRAAYALDPSKSGFLPTFAVYDSDRAPLGIAGSPRDLAVQSFPFTITDASGDDSPQTVFQLGALRYSYDFSSQASAVINVDIEAWQDGRFVETLQSSFNAASAVNKLVDLNRLTTPLAPGEYLITATALLSNGTVKSTQRPMTVLAGDVTKGLSFLADNLTYSKANGTGAIFLGYGGTDTLNLDVRQNAIVSIDGMSLNAFRQRTMGLNADQLPNAANSITSQAIYHGTAFDYLRLADGREIYFQGIERLGFADASPALILQVQTNDPQSFTNGAPSTQGWNLIVTDVVDAWRFTTGSSDVVFASVDGGIPPSEPTPVDDLDPHRILTNDQSFNDGTAVGFKPNEAPEPADDEHGNTSLSIMTSVPNNNRGPAGINWVSRVGVYNAFYYNKFRDGITLSTQAALAALAKPNVRVIVQSSLQDGFAGGIRFKNTLQDGLEDLVAANPDNALFAFSAGNGGQEGDPNFLTTVTGFATLQTNHNNVIAVGAVYSPVSFVRLPTPAIPNTIPNAILVNISPSSNRGSNLTLVAPTDSPATFSNGDTGRYSGTSAAAPNLAGIASLVWSIDPNLTAGDVRSILTDSSMQLLPPRSTSILGAIVTDTQNPASQTVTMDEKASGATGIYAGMSMVVNKGRSDEETITIVSSNVGQPGTTVDTITAVFRLNHAAGASLEPSTPVTNILGRNNTFGSGLVDADMAVRRVYALKTARDLATLNGFGNNEFPSDPGPTGSLRPGVSAIASQSFPEGATARITTRISEPTDRTPWSYTVNWGDGSTPDSGTVKGTPVLNKGGTPNGSFGGTLNATHVYAQDRTYTGVVTVTDQSGNLSSTTFQITVTDVNPTIEAFTGNPVTTGQVVDLRPIKFHDQGTLDTHTTTIDWGDGKNPPIDGVVIEHPFGPPGSTSGADGTVDFPGYSYTKVQTGPIWFDSSSFDLSNSDKTVLTNFAGYLNDPAHADLKVQVAGYTDTRAPSDPSPFATAAAYNLALSKDRADAAAAFLRSAGVAANRISEVWYGQDQNAIDVGPDKSNQSNRRVELNVQYPIKVTVKDQDGHEGTRTITNPLTVINTPFLTNPTNLPLLVDSGDTSPAPIDSSALTVDQLQPIVAEAIARWSAAGASGAQIAALTSASFQIAALPASQAGATTDNTVTISPDAAGYGWFVDLTPGDNLEFGHAASSTEFHAIAGSPPFVHVDLLTVVSHELGHVLGLPEFDPVAQPGDVMDPSILLGVRRIPQAADLNVLAAGALPAGSGESHPQEVASPTEPTNPFINGDFNQGAENLTGWLSTETGRVVVNAEHQAVITESAHSIQVELTQEFQIPANAAQMIFTIDRETFDAVIASGVTPDAFGVALIDPVTLQPLTQTVDTLTDSFFIQDLRAGSIPETAPGVVVGAADADGARQVTVNVAGLGGHGARLIFRFLGGSDATQLAGSVAVSHVGFAAPPTFPVLSATMTVALGLDRNGDGKANPGDTLQYTVSIANTGTAAGPFLNFTPGVDPTTTFLADTVVFSPALTVATLLDDATLATIVAAARQRWEIAGISAAQDELLRQLQFRTADLAGVELAQTQVNEVLVSRTGAVGWFIDPTPLDDSEFATVVSATRRTAVTGSAALGKADVLTTVMREMGAMLGVNPVEAPDLLGGPLEQGARSLPPGSAAFTLSQLKTTFGFHDVGSYYQSVLGGNEKWFHDRNEQWFSLLPNGDLIQWDGISLATSIVTPVAHLSPLVYDDPTLLFNAAPVLSSSLQTQLTNLRIANGFHDVGSYYQSVLGGNEKWFHDRNEQWFSLLPNGDLVKWDGVSLATSIVTPVAHLSPAVYDDPKILFNASVSLSTSLQTQLSSLRAANGFHYLGTYYQSVLGGNEKWFHDRNEQWFSLLPNGDLIQWDSVSLATSAANVATTVHLDPLVFDNPNLLLDAAVTLTGALQTQLSNLRTAHGFHDVGSYYQDVLGGNEKWFHDRNEQWFSLLPNGDLIQWDGISLATSIITPVAHLSPLVYDDPTLLLHAAVSVSGSVQTQLANLRTANGFHDVGSYYQSVLGGNEKWFHDRNEQWFSLLPNGDLIRWDGISFATSIVTPVAHLSPLVYDDPDLLFSAAVSLPGSVQAQLTSLRSANGFHDVGSYYQSILGGNEKWFHDRNEQWFSLLPNGDLIRWDGVSLATSIVTPVAHLSPLVYDDPTRLFNAALAVSSSVGAQLPALREANGFHYLGTYYQSALGGNEKWFHDRNEQWFSLQPNGDLVKWDGISLATSKANAATTVHLDPFLYDDPNRLFYATAEGDILPSLAPIGVGASVGLTYQARIPGILPAGVSTLVAQGAISAGNAPPVVAPFFTDNPGLPGAADSTAIAVTSASLLRVTASGPGAAVQGDTISFTILYLNLGTTGDTGVVIKVDLPAGFQFQPDLSTAGWSIEGGIPVYRVGSLAAGGSGSLNLTVKLSAHGTATTLFEIGDDSSLGLPIDAVSLGTAVSTRR